MVMAIHQRIETLACPQAEPNSKCAIGGGSTEIFVVLVRRRAKPVAPQCGDKCRGLPVAERRLGEEPAAARGTTIEPGHLGAGAGLVDEDELVGIDKGLRRPPDAAPGGDIRTVLLGGAERLFLNDSPSRATADHIAPLLTQTPCSLNNHLWSAASVISG